MHVRTAAAVNQSGRTPAIKQQKLMETIKEIKDKVQELKDKLHSDRIHQYTIDFFEELDEELFLQEIGEGGVENSTFFGAESYKICNLLEIVDKETEDYILYERLLEIIEEGRKL